MTRKDRTRVLRSIGISFATILIAWGCSDQVTSSREDTGGAGGTKSSGSGGKGGTAGSSSSADAGESGTSGGTGGRDPGAGGSDASDASGGEGGEVESGNEGGYGGEPDGSDSGGSSGNGGSGGASGAGNGGTSSNGGGGAGGTSGNGGGGTGGTSGNGGGGAGGTGGAPNTLPCDVVAALQAKCQTCHSNPPQGEAPMALVTYNDVKAYSATIASFISVENDVMPPPGAPNLTAEQRAAISNYIAAGMPSAGNAGCQ